jgi:hypothetical protein
MLGTSSALSAVTPTNRDHNDNGNAKRPFSNVDKMRRHLIERETCAAVLPAARIEARSREADLPGTRNAERTLHR